MRQYTPLWLILRTRKIVRFRAHPVHHHHIIRMVSKEKYEDIPFQLGLRKTGRKAWITVSIEADVITLKLGLSISLADLGIVQYKDQEGQWKLALDSIPNITLLE